VNHAAAELRSAGHRPLLLVGYSMGSAASLAAAPRTQPDGLALVAPFWWQEKLWLRIVGGALRPFLPSSFRPLSKVNFDDPRIREGISKFLPGANLADPEVQAGLRKLRFPLRLIEQVATSRLQRSARCQRDCAGAACAGKEDPVVRPGDAEIGRAVSSWRRLRRGGRGLSAHVAGQTLPGPKYPVQ
jgi:alpha-beta hydrolase superfamily lysophospholipase